MELRYYDVPQNEFLIALQGETWKRKYGSEDSLMHFHNLLEIGVCRSGQDSCGWIMRRSLTGVEQSA
ncbi:MAG: hypothetical protein V8R80_02980 [Eubacterium sp.]